MHKTKVKYCFEDETSPPKANRKRQKFDFNDFKDQE
jgi:hypothetical protein